APEPTPAPEPPAEATPAPAPAPAPAPPAAPKLPWQVRETAGALNLTLNLPKGAIPHLRVLEGPVIMVQATGLHAQPDWPRQQPGQDQPLHALRLQPGAGGAVDLSLELAPGQYTLLQLLELASGVYHLDIFPRGEARHE
ncbi:MAG: hypothetical protein V1797_13085, partial [Pseudomonadota bacterium]